MSIAEFLRIFHLQTTADPIMVRVKGPEIIYDFRPFKLVERKGSCRLSTTAKRQMEMDKRLTLLRGCDSSKKENAAMA